MMPSVGMIGNNASEMAIVFLRMCQTGGIPAERVDLAKNNKKNTYNDYKMLDICKNDMDLPNEYKHAPVSVQEPIAVCVPVNEQNVERLNLLVIQDACGSLKHFIKPLTLDDFLIVNADKKEIFPCLEGCDARLVTYGFNAKSCVTASSVTDTELQVCIQRGIPSLDGLVREPQEFAVPFMHGLNASSVLGAVTACLVCGVL